MASFFSSVVRCEYISKYLNICDLLKIDPYGAIYKTTFDIKNIYEDIVIENYAIACDDAEIYNMGCLHLEMKHAFLKNIWVPILKDRAEIELRELLKIDCGIGKDCWDLIVKMS